MQNHVETAVKRENPKAETEKSYRIIKIDGNTINMDEGTVYRGLGVVTGNNSSRLLMDYKTEHPDAYWEIMRLLFLPDYGAGLTHIKIEFGTDVNSSSGTEPCIMRSADEKADVTRGAGFMFAADALTINPDITVDLLRWGEPKWVTDAFLQSRELGFEARYRWYKAALDGAYDRYGMKFTHVSADGNETDRVDTDWIIYFADRLKKETGGRYDYGTIKIIASDEVGSWSIADEMMSNEKLRDSVDILGGHYQTVASANAKILNKAYSKEIWYTEGVAPTNIARLAVTENGSGLNGINGALGVCNCVINSYYNGNMTMYEYQPAVAAYYSGVKYFPKALLNAQTPWSGYYEADCGIWTSAHFTHFIKKGWRYVDSACYGDGREDHFITDTTDNYMTVANTETGDYSVVICNDSGEARRYTLTLEHMKRADKPVTIWETRGPDAGQAYNANYFRRLGTDCPAEENGTYSYSVEVKPYSLVTVTTLDQTADTSVCDCGYEDIPLGLPYSDDFAYTGEFLAKRGNAPRYTTDYGGAFEVAEVNGSNVLMQMIGAENKPTDWRFRSTPNPVTLLGDDCWSDYSVQIEFRFAEDAADNYIFLGSRHLTAELHEETAQNGYALRIAPDGKWELKKNAETVVSGYVQKFEPAAWHSVTVTAEKNTVTAAIDGTVVTEYADAAPLNHSGRVAIGSGLYHNLFCHLKISPIGSRPVVRRMDDHDPSITYTGNWKRTVPDGYLHFNRTRSKAVVNRETPEEKSFAFSFQGSRFALIGQTETAQLDVCVDGELLEAAVSIPRAEARQCHYTADIADGKHSITVKVTGGSYALDAIEYK